jgi:hypothetical protein
MHDGLTRATATLAGLDDHVDAVARLTLGVVILAAGVHKLLAPEAWAVYVVPWLAALLPMTPVEFMLLNGVLEPPFAAALLADRYTVFAAAFVAVSLAATVVYLAVVGLTTGQFVDVLIRDIGLTALAVVVAVRAAAS